MEVKRTTLVLFLFVALSFAHLMLDPEQEGNTRVRSPHINYNALHERGCTGENSHERACETACNCPTVFAATVYPSDITPQVRTAFEFAKCIWSCVLKDLPVTRNEDLIRIAVSSFQSASLTLATGGGQFVGINNAQFGVCAVESVRGSTQCNSLVAQDISIRINTDQSVYPNFYFGLDCNPARNQIDFVSVVIHEIGHGLGFSGLISNNNIAYQSSQLVALIDTFYTVGIGGNKPWTSAPVPNVAAAQAAIVSNNLYFDGVLFDNGKLYAPSSFSGGSSIYHWDEATYPSGDINSLMTPSIAFGEAIHAIGPLTCDYLTRWGYPINNINVLCGLDVLAVPAPLSQSPTPTRPAPSQSPTPTRPAPSQTGTPTRPVPSQSPTPTRPALSQTGTPTRPVPSQSPTPTRPAPSQTGTPTRPVQSRSPTPTRIAPSQTGTPTRVASRSRSPLASRTSTKTPFPSKSASRSAARKAKMAENAFEVENDTVSGVEVISVNFEFNEQDSFSVFPPSSSNSLAASIIFILFVCVTIVLL